MLKNYRLLVFFFVLIYNIFTITAQEALLSTEEEYFSFLSLQGLVLRPTLNYRTLSDSVWKFNSSSDSLDVDRNLWNQRNNNSDRMITDQVALKVYGPNFFTSFNSAVPYGQNDGLLWQGKGLNTSLTGGLRFEGYGFELTVKPQFVFSQNLSFDLMKSAYDSEYGYIWGYGANRGVDAPQRFGNSSFFDWSLGDSEIRYTWNKFTVGFGTQAIWLGPAQINPLLHSNNAVPYPKVDIGLRRTAINLPYFGRYIGDIEFRIWTGYLSESNYFDNNDENDHNMLHGLTFSYAPSFLPGLVLSANRTCLVKWKLENLRYIIPLSENTFIGETGLGEDQKMSLAACWSFPEVGFEVYGELGRDDFAAAGMKYPFHSMTYTVGLQKGMVLSTKFSLYGKLLFEWNNTEMSQDFQFQWPYNFGFHHQITQGYTNGGQWLGSGIGYGGNSQYLGYTVYYPKGSILLYLHRYNPDNNFLYKDTIGTATIKDDNRFFSWKTFFAGGVSTETFIDPKVRMHAGVALVQVRNPLYLVKAKTEYNFNASLGIKYLF